jgi:hypothetical protein
MSVNRKQGKIAHQLSGKHGKFYPFSQKRCVSFCIFQKSKKQWKILTTISSFFLNTDLVPDTSIGDCLDPEFPGTSLQEKQGEGRERLRLGRPAYQGGGRSVVTQQRWRKHSGGQ